MDERMRFVARRLNWRVQDLQSLSGMRYHGLTDRSRRLYRYANQLPFQVENHILNVKGASWGARKIRERLIRGFSGIPIPAKGTSLRAGGAPRSCASTGAGHCAFLGTAAQ
jgi:putative transposase